MPQIEWNGDGFYYLIRWRKVPENEDEEEEEFDLFRVPFPAAYHQVLPGNFETYKEYVITVKAGNTVGESRTPVAEIHGFSGEDSKYCSLQVTYIITYHAVSGWSFVALAVLCRFYCLHRYRAHIR